MFLSVFWQKNRKKSPHPTAYRGGVGRGEFSHVDGFPALSGGGGELSVPTSGGEGGSEIPNFRPGEGRFLTPIFRREGWTRKNYSKLH